MNKQSAYLPAWACLIALTAGLSWIDIPVQTPQTDTFKRISYDNIHGAREYLHALRADPTTGKIDLADIYQARRKADQLKLRSKNGQAGPDLQWEEMGPNNVGGRTRGLLVDKFNPSRVYSGGVAGGLWVSHNSGEAWERINGGDTLKALAVASITQASNGDIYFGTGEGAYTNFGNGGGGIPGEGIFKSTDGINFTHLSATLPGNSNSTFDGWAHVNRMAADWHDPNVIYAATTGGLMKTVDGGLTWENIINGEGMEVQTASDGTVMAVVNNRLYRSMDSGLNFEDLSSRYANDTEGPRTGSRFVVGIAPSDPDYIYVMTVHTLNIQECGNDPQENIFPSVLRNIYQSKNKGEDWEVMMPGVFTREEYCSGQFNPVGDQGYYDLALTVDPNNREKIIIAGQLQVWSWSDTGGWNFIAHSGHVHADHHRIAFHPTNSDIFYIGTDGGVYKTTNATDKQPTFKAFNKGYSVTQFYGVAAALTGEVMGGAQDNGTQYIDFSGNSIQTSKHVNHSDGGYCDISKINPDVMFSERQEGFVERSSNRGEGWSSVFDRHIDSAEPLGSPDNGAAFIHPFTLWEEVVYTTAPTGSQMVDTENSMSRLFTGSRSQIWMGEDVSTNLANTTWFHLGNVSGGDITCLSPSKDGQYLYLGTSSGQVFRVSNFKDVNYVYNDDDQFSAADSGITVRRIGTLSRHVKDIAVSVNDPGHIVAALVNYGGSNYVYEATDADVANNANFVSLQNDLPPMPVYGAEISPYDSNTIILGTELGIWATNDGGDTWFENNEGMARVPVFRLRQDLLYEEGCYVLYAGTHGRGIFRSTTLTPGNCGTKVNVRDIEPNNLSQLNLYPNPMAQFTRVEYLLQESSPVTVQVYDLQGKLMRQEAIPRKGSGKHSIILEKGNLTTGTYLVSIRSDNSLESTKLIVQ